MARMTLSAESTETSRSAERPPYNKTSVSLDIRFLSILIILNNHITNRKHFQKYWKDMLQTRVYKKYHAFPIQRKTNWKYRPMVFIEKYQKEEVCNATPL